MKTHEERGTRSDDDIAVSRRPAAAPGKAPATGPHRASVQRKTADSTARDSGRSAGQHTGRDSARTSSGSGASETWTPAALLGVSPAVQAHGDLSGHGTEHIHQAAGRGISGSSQSLPHLGAIQKSFGPAADVSGISAHVGGPAAEACDSIGAAAYATGTHVAFKQSPNLHTAAHEAAHVIQQRGGVWLSGGVGRAGDPWEVHADRVAD
ncbi:MAG: DUF4157 domain-containing protein, partial [Myxococcota bacterium]